MTTFTTQEAFDKEGFCYFNNQKKKHTVIGALPGEEVTAVFIGRKRKDSFYILDEVIKPSPFRVKAPCQDVPRCGGCVFQSFDYSQQLAHKESKIRNLFLDDVDKVLPIIPSPKKFHYRAKMEFSFSQNKAGEKFLGLTQAKGNGRVIATKLCHLAPDWMNKALAITQVSFCDSHLRAYDRKGLGDLRSLILREGANTQEKMVVLEVIAHNGSELKKKDLEHFFKPLREIDPSISCYLRIVQMIPKVPTQIYEMHLSGPSHIHESLRVQDRNLIFKISPSAFFQPNPSAAAVLLNTIIGLIKPLDVKRVCDLFCGTGTIGLAIAPFVENVVGVEINPYSVFDAKENGVINNLSNVCFVQKDAALFMQDVKDAFDLFVVDPPRAGLGLKACDLIINTGVKYLLYVSCNPVTQADDIHIFQQKGYEILALQPLDQFPHTNHVENIILLKKRA